MPVARPCGGAAGRVAHQAYVPGAGTTCSFSPSSTLVRVAAAVVNEAAVEEWTRTRSQAARPAAKASSTLRPSPPSSIAGSSSI